MSLYPIAARFRRRARVITVGAVLGILGIGAGAPVAMLLTDRVTPAFAAAYLIAMLAVSTMLAWGAVVTRRLNRALRVLSARHPGDVVFLARRLPPVVSDMPAYLRDKGIQFRVGDGWHPILADARGISLHRSGGAPHEILLMEWSEIGLVETVRTATVGGDSRWSVVVAVQPYDVPLTIDLGDAWGVVTMPLDAADTAAVVQAVLAKRP